MAVTVPPAGVSRVIGPNTHHQLAILIGPEMLPLTRAGNDAVARLVNRDAGRVDLRLRELCEMNIPVGRCRCNTGNHPGYVSIKEIVDK